MTTALPLMPCQWVNQAYEKCGLTVGRWVLLKILRNSGPISIRALASELGRDYKNVYTDVRRLKFVGLIDKTKDNKIEVPWDIVEARLMLAA